VAAVSSTSRVGAPEAYPSQTVKIVPGCTAAGASEPLRACLRSRSVRHSGACSLWKTGQVRVQPFFAWQTFSRLHGHCVDG
jgi:hypothetical protein